MRVARAKLLFCQSKNLLLFCLSRRRRRRRYYLSSLISEYDGRLKTTGAYHLHKPPGWESCT